MQLPLRMDGEELQRGVQRLHLLDAVSEQRYLRNSAPTARVHLHLRVWLHRQKL